MPNTQETIRAFYANIENKDFDAVRALLHDDLDFQGPMDQFDRAEGLVAKLTNVQEATQGFDVRHLFVDGDRACCVYDLRTATPIGSSPVTEYFELRDGRISMIRAHYDSRPWIALMSNDAG